MEYIKGITLNAQLVDLLSIIDNKEYSKEQQDEQIIKYIEELKHRQSEYLTAKSNGTGERLYLQKAIESINGLSNEQMQGLQELYESSFNGMKICNNEYMNQLLEKNGFDRSINTKIMKNLKNLDFVAKEGITELTPDKVRALYLHMFGNGNRYDRVTLDNVGKFSDYVSIDGQTYVDDKLKKMIEFCERHNMTPKINTLIFYADYPVRFENMLDTQVEDGTLSEQDKKTKIKQILMNYVSDIGEKYGDRIDTVDIFNELIYDPNIREKGPTGEDIYKEENSYHERKKGWQKYLSMEDLCEVALLARKKMPNVTFTYNDANWVNSEKRKEIIQNVQNIQKIEQKYREEGKLDKDEKGLIDTLGLEAHLSSNVKIRDIDKVFIDIEESKIGLPIEVTELDVGIFENPPSKKSIEKQSKIFRKIHELAQTKPELISLTIWSQSDECCFLNKKVGYNVHASLLDSNFQEKNILEKSKKSYDKSFTKNKIKSIIELVKESIKGIPNFTLLDEVEQEERKIENQKSKQEDIQDI